MIFVNNEPLITFDMEKIELLRKLSTYVAHSEHVWKNTFMKDKYRRLEYVAQSKQLISTLYKYSDTSLICQEINANRHSLRYILPDRNNPSYDSSEANFMELINCCRTKLHLPAYQPKIKA